jgi:hypothetical protein
MARLARVFSKNGGHSLDVQPSHRKGVIEVRTSDNFDGQVVEIEAVDFPETFVALESLYTAMRKEGVVF